MSYLSAVLLGQHCMPQLPPPGLSADLKEALSETAADKKAGCGLLLTCQLFLIALLLFLADSV